MTRHSRFRDISFGEALQFDMGDWEPDKKVQIDWRTVYMWTVTEKAKAQFAEK